MTFKYACFISYRSGDEMNDTFAKQLKDALEVTLIAYRTDDSNFKCDVYLDIYDIKGRIPFPPQIAQALCQSYCMILILNDGYFSKGITGEHWCTREYLLMEELEKQRIPNLIIPIKFKCRHYSQLENITVEDIRQKIQKYQVFSEWNLSQKPIKYNETFVQSKDGIKNPIDQICDEIWSIYCDLVETRKNLTKDCQKINLPSETDAKRFITEKKLDRNPILGFPTQAPLPYIKTGFLNIVSFITNMLPKYN